MIDTKVFLDRPGVCAFGLGCAAVTIGVSAAFADVLDGPQNGLCFGRHAPGRPIFSMPIASRHHLERAAIWGPNSPLSTTEEWILAHSF